MLGQIASPFAASAVVFGLAGLALLPLAAVLRPPEAAAQAVPLRTSVFLGMLLLTVPAALLTLAGQHGIAGWTPLLYAAMPLLLTLVSGAWSPAMILAIGLVLVLLNGTVPLEMQKLPWVLVALAAVASQACALHLAAGMLPKRSLRQLAGSLMLQLASASVVLALLSLFLDPHPRIAPVAQWSALQFSSLALLSVFGTAGAYLLLLWLLARTVLSPAEIATTQWLQTLITVVESALFAHYLPPPLSLIAAAVLLGCVATVLRGGITEEAITLRGSSPQ